MAPLQRRRMLSLCVDVLALAGAWLGPLPRLAPGSFSAHMTIHMTVVAVAAPFLALAVAGSRWDPAVRWPAALAPIPASLVELVVVWLWHAPAIHHLARHSRVGVLLEQSTFLASGLLVWTSATGGAGPERRGRIAAGVVALLLTSMHMTLLGALLALAPRPLFHHHGPAAGGLTPLDDQHLGGAIMLLVGGLAYLSGGLALTAGLLRRRLAPRQP